MKSLKSKKTKIVTKVIVLVLGVSVIPATVAQASLTRAADGYVFSLSTSPKYGTDMDCSPCKPKESAADIYVKCTEANYPMTVWAVGSCVNGYGAVHNCSSGYEYVLDAFDQIDMYNTVLPDGYPNAGVMGQCMTDDDTYLDGAFNPDLYF